MNDSFDSHSQMIIIFKIPFWSPRHIPKGCRTTVPQTGWLETETHSVVVLEAGSLRSSRRLGWLLLEAVMESLSQALGASGGFWQSRAFLTAISASVVTWPSLYVSVASSSYKDTSHWIRDNPSSRMTSSWDPQVILPAKHYFQIRSYSEILYMNLEGTPFNPTVIKISPASIQVTPLPNSVLFKASPLPGCLGHWGAGGGEA